MERKSGHQGQNGAVESLPWSLTAIDSQEIVNQYKIRFGMVRPPRWRTPWRSR
jgi:hypothetical protein